MTSNKTLEEILYQFSRYCKHHARTGLGGEGITQPEAKAQIEALYLPREAVARAIPKRREQLIDMAGRLYEPEWLQGYNQAINEIRSKLKLDDKEVNHDKEH